MYGVPPGMPPELVPCWLCSLGGSGLTMENGVGFRCGIRGASVRSGVRQVGYLPALQHCAVSFCVAC